jgi:hypothetical protein
VIGSPLRIPLPLDELQGRDFVSGSSDLRAGIARECGGTQCVSVTKVGESTVLPEGADCDTILFVQDADPDTSPPFVDVARGGTITVVVNVRCEDVPPQPAPAESSEAPTSDPGPSDESPAPSDSP